MPSTILSTHLVSQLPTSLGTMTVPITLRAAAITNIPPMQAAMTRSASGTIMALLDGSGSAELTTPGSAGGHAVRSRRAGGKRTSNGRATSAPFIPALHGVAPEG